MMVHIGDKSFRLLHETGFRINRLQVLAHHLKIIADFPYPHLCRFTTGFILCRIVFAQCQDKTYRIVLQVVRLFVDLQRITVAQGIPFSRQHAFTDCLIALRLFFRLVDLFLIGFAPDTRMFFIRQTDQSKSGCSPGGVAASRRYQRVIEEKDRLFQLIQESHPVLFGTESVLTLGMYLLKGRNVTCRRVPAELPLCDIPAPDGFEMGRTIVPGRC